VVGYKGDERRAVVVTSSSIGTMLAVAWGGRMDDTTVLKHGHKNLSSAYTKVKMENTDLADFLKHYS
jgi:hypothetical protein